MQSNCLIEQSFCGARSFVADGMIIRDQASATQGRRNGRAGARFLHKVYFKDGQGLCFLDPEYTKQHLCPPWRVVFRAKQCLLRLQSRLSHPAMASTQNLLYISCAASSIRRGSPLRRMGRSSGRHVQPRGSRCRGAHLSPIGTALGRDSLFLSRPRIPEVS